MMEEEAREREDLSRYTVRVAAIEDAEVIVEFNRAMARETESRELDPGVLRAGVESLLADPARGCYFIAEERPGPGGGGEGVTDRAGGAGAPRAVGQLMITHEWSDWRNGDAWWIQSVYVVPEHRRRGVYRLLHEQVREMGKKRGAVGLRLYVDRENRAAQATYRRLGMAESRYVMFEEMWV